MCGEAPSERTDSDGDLRQDCFVNKRIVELIELFRDWQPLPPARCVEIRLDPALYPPNRQLIIVRAKQIRWSASAGTSPVTIQAGAAHLGLVTTRNRSAIRHHLVKFVND